MCVGVTAAQRLGVTLNRASQCPPAQHARPNRLLAEYSRQSSRSRGLRTCAALRWIECAKHTRPARGSRCASTRCYHRDRVTARRQRAASPYGGLQQMTVMLSTTLRTPDVAQAVFLAQSRSRQLLAVPVNVTSAPWISTRMVGVSP